MAGHYTKFPKFEEVAMNKVWKDHERQFIKDNAGRMKDKEIATKLSQITGRKVTTQAVRKQRQKMGIQKEQGRGICKVVGQAGEDYSAIGRSVTKLELHSISPCQTQ